MPKPVLQALVLADHVYTDAGTGKKVIAGTFNALWARTFPSRFSRSTFAYMALTDMRGETRLRLQYRNLASGVVLIQTPEFNVPPPPDPLSVAEFVIEVPPLPMPEAGTYAFDVLAKDELVGSIRLSIGLADIPPPHVRGDRPNA